MGGIINFICSLRLQERSIDTYLIDSILSVLNRVCVDDTHSELWHLETSLNIFFSLCELKKVMLRILSRPTKQVFFKPSFNLLRTMSTTEREQQVIENLSKVRKEVEELKGNNTVSFVNINLVKKLMRIIFCFIF